jgi:hypothetical protein
MKKLLASLPFATVAVGGAIMFVASIFGAFQQFGIGTELTMLSLGFLTAVLGAYSTYLALTEF